MAANEVVQIRSRRGSAEEWAQVNPRLGPGEWGVELDTGLAKLGDGSRSWNDLPYGAGGAPLLALAQNVTEADTTIEYDAGSSSSVTIYWVFQEGASGTHHPIIRNGRPGTQVFFLARNNTSEDQEIGGEGNYWLAPGGAGVQLTTTLQANEAKDSWLAANGAVIEDQQVGVAVVFAVTT
jgi:hypothetical protein